MSAATGRVGEVGDTRGWHSSHSIEYGCCRRVRSESQTTPFGTHLGDDMADRLGVVTRYSYGISGVAPLGPIQMSSVRKRPGSNGAVDVNFHSHQTNRRIV